MHGRGDPVLRWHSSPRGPLLLRYATLRVVPLRSSHLLPAAWLQADCRELRRVREAQSLLLRLHYGHKMEITGKSTNVIVEDVPALFRVCSLSPTINCVAKDEWISQTQ